MLKVRALILLFLPLFAAAQDISSLPLEELLPKEQQAAIGLTSQTAEQREMLRRILIAYYRSGYAEGQKVVAESTAPVARPTPSSVIESQIDGDFHGWEGEAIYKLRNGQVWQQASYHYHYHYAYAPKVVIYLSGGAYKMKVDGDDDEAISVKLLGR